VITHSSVVIIFVLALNPSTAAAEIDKDTQARAEIGFAAEVYGIVSGRLTEKLSERGIDQDAQDKLVFVATKYISACVISDFVARPVPGSEKLVRALASLPDDANVRETLKLRYGNEEAETLWLNVEYVLDQCVGRAYELLGIDDQ
jgi:hypothetical protein